MKTPGENPSLDDLERIVDAIDKLNTRLSEEGYRSDELKLDLENSSDSDLMIESIHSIAPIINKLCKEASRKLPGNSYELGINYFKRLRQSLSELVNVLMPYLEENENDKNGPSIMEIRNLLRDADDFIGRMLDWIYNAPAYRK